MPARMVLLAVMIRDDAGSRKTIALRDGGECAQLESVGCAVSGVPGVRHAQVAITNR